MSQAETGGYVMKRMSKEPRAIPGPHKNLVDELWLKGNGEFGELYWD
jgi:hypothetical protein